MSRALPWITLGLGISLGILWMSWRTQEVGMNPNGDTVLRTPSSAPGAVVQFRRSRLA
ncbi:MAG: hypothetical protein Q7J69_00580 [Candidatus Omnitrophota bacterium]|nr:hypothetical protein [Candidatus Omnitrophota bacterium]